MGDHGPEQAERTLSELDRLRHRTHTRTHGGAWLPAAAIALLLLASTALYRLPFGQPNGYSADYTGYSAYPYWAGLPDEQRSPIASYVFWFLGTPLLFAALGAWYRWRAQRLGLRVAWPVFAGTGLGVLLLLAVLAAVPKADQPADGLLGGGGTFSWGWRGLLTPLLPIAVAVVALGWTERSRGLAAAGVWIALLAAWLCGTFPLGSLPPWASGILTGDGNSLGGQLSLRPGHYLVLMALPLLLFAAVRARRARRIAGD